MSIVVLGEGTDKSVCVGGGGAITPRNIEVTCSKSHRYYVRQVLSMSHHCNANNLHSRFVSGLWPESRYNNIILSFYVSLLIPLVCLFSEGVNSEEICFDKFGCFSSYPRCHSAEFSFPPKSPEEIETNIYLFTNKNPEHYQDITDWRTDGVISDSFFDGSLETKVLIHGFNGRILDEINVETKDAILETVKYT